MSEPFGTLERKRSWDFLSLALDTLNKDERLLSVNVALEALWDSARNASIKILNHLDNKIHMPDTIEELEDNRVPVFIVIDEAHNFIPISPRGSLQDRLTDKIIQIASEGRKYGLFLILLTQRPSKLHHSVVPECENSIILQLQAPSEIDFAINKLGLNKEYQLKIPTLESGNGILNGRWANKEKSVEALFSPTRCLLGGNGITNYWIK